jgi:hypothetical protein
MRWLKILFGIDPLVGMYFVTYVRNGVDPNMGRILGRIETGNTPKYLLHYFLSEEQRGIPGDNILIAELWLENGSDWCTFHETRREAQKWRVHRRKVAERERTLHPLQPCVSSKPAWEPPWPN